MPNLPKKIKVVFLKTFYLGQFYSGKFNLANLILELKKKNGNSRILAAFDFKKWGTVSQGKKWVDIFVVKLQTRYGHA